METGLSGLGGILYGVLAASLAVVLVAGGLVLSFEEGEAPPAFMPPPTTTSVGANQAPTPLLSATLPVRAETPTSLATSSSTFTPSALPSSTLTATGTLLPTQTDCPPPAGWKPITIARGDTLNKLAQEYGTTSEELIEANCLVKSQLEPGATLYVPVKAPPTAVPCGPPNGWRYPYIVQPGDTLFSISRRAGVSVAQLKQANCLTSDRIRVGQKLYLPVSIEPPEPPTRTPTEVEPTNPPPTDTPEVERTRRPPDPTLVIPALSGT